MFLLCVSIPSNEEEEKMIFTIIIKLRCDAGFMIIFDVCLFVFRSFAKTITGPIQRVLFLSIIEVHRHKSTKTRINLLKEKSKIERKKHYDNGVLNGWNLHKLSNRTTNQKNCFIFI